MRDIRGGPLLLGLERSDVSLAVPTAFDLARIPKAGADDGARYASRRSSTKD